MSDFSSRVINFRQRLGFTQKELGKMLGVSGNYIYKVESGRSEPSESLVLHFNMLAESPLYETQNTAVLREDPARAESNANPQRLELRLIPLLSWVQAGQATEFELIPTEWENEVEYYGNDSKAFGLVLRGDSMEPKYSNGDIVIVSPSVMPRNGDLVVANLRDEGVLFKLMHVNGTHDVITLTSYNPAYPPIKIQRDKFHWMYPVRKVIKNAI